MISRRPAPQAGRPHERPHERPGAGVCVLWPGLRGGGAGERASGAQRPTGAPKSRAARGANKKGPIRSNRLETKKSLTCNAVRWKPERHPLPLLSCLCAAGVSLHRGVRGPGGTCEPKGGGGTSGCERSDEGVRVRVGHQNSFDHNLAPMPG
jgi:hypothetical protein